MFLSQTRATTITVAFITGREKPEPSNSVHHVAFRSAGTLDDLKALKKTLEADSEVTQIMPLTHGNAWSVYFRDPEFNGVEVFIDTPWHVRQPQGEPLDLDKSNDEIVDGDPCPLRGGARSSARSTSSTGARAEHLAQR